MRTLGRVNRIAPRVLKTDPFSVFRWYNFYKGWVVELCNWLGSAVAALFAGGRWTRAVSGETLGEKQYEVDMWTRRPSLVWFAKSYLPEDYRRSRKLSAADADGFDRANTRPITSFQQFNCWTSSSGNRFNKGQPVRVGPLWRGNFRAPGARRKTNMLHGNANKKSASDMTPVIK